MELTGLDVHGSLRRLLVRALVPDIKAQIDKSVDG